ncbi:hypothetical protein RJ639_035277, partial [Escallonia herrerae]
MDSSLGRKKREEEVAAEAEDLREEEVAAEAEDLGWSEVMGFKGGDKFCWRGGVARLTRSNRRLPYDIKMCLLFNIHGVNCIVQNFSLLGVSQRDLRVFASSGLNEASNYIPAALIFLPEGPWKQYRVELKVKAVLRRSLGESLLQSLILHSSLAMLMPYLQVGGTRIGVGGMAKWSGMIHPNMATLLGVYLLVITTDAMVTSDVWRKMVKVAVNRSFNQITVDGDTGTNDVVIALASGLSGSNRISSLNKPEAEQLQLCLDAVMQGLAKSIAWDGEGATCLIEVTVTGADSEAEAANAAVYGRDPNWGRIACAAGYAGISFDPNMLRISLGSILLINGGQPLPFD